MTNIDDRVSADLHRALSEDLETVRADLESVCESPIEIALGTALIGMWKIQGESFALLAPLSYTIDGYDPSFPNLYSAILAPQYVKNGARHDFAIFHPVLNFPVIIECDGHEFHERTKEQAKRDRARDRKVQTRGAAILRFTGSEIYASPAACAIEIMDFVSIALVHGR